ncbi:hypothetical protein B0T09DRAFT_348700 [Sordaria sp. MPI-SDFR-AT-0083]|nr:hypothetical protein B0T09DRAFT_348700 [Sordaria sp. MPI-SDFR-AT-0083]
MARCMYKRRVEMHCLASGFVRTLLSTYALLLHAVPIADLNVLSHLVKEFEVQKPQRPHSIFSFQVKEVEVSCVTGRRADMNAWNSPQISYVTWPYLERCHPTLCCRIPLQEKARFQGRANTQFMSSVSWPKSRHRGCWYSQRRGFKTSIQLNWALTSRVSNHLSLVSSSPKPMLNCHMAVVVRSWWG